MKRIAAYVACLGFIASAVAADPARLAEARAVMKAMQVDKMMDQMVNAMTAGMARQMNELGGPGDPRAARIAMEESASVMRERAMRPGGLIDTMTEAYADEFSIDELRQIRAFHESPVGKHMLDSGPRMMQRVMERTPIVTREAMVEVCERVNARMQREKVPGKQAKCAEMMK